MIHELGLFRPKQDDNSTTILLAILRPWKLLIDIHMQLTSFWDINCNSASHQLNN